MAIQSLFGPSPAQVMEQRRKEAEQEILQQGKEFGVFAPLYQAGLRFGEQSRQSMQGMFPGQQDAALQEATAVQSVLAKYADQDQSNPAILSQIGRELLPIAPNAGFKALEMASKLQKENKLTTVAPGASVIDASGDVVFTAPNRDEDPLKAASRDKFEEIYSRYPDTPAGRAQAAVEFRNWDNQFKERVSAAAAGPGELKVTDVAGARKISEDIVGGDKDRLTTIGLLKTNIETIRQKNPTAVPQLERGLVKLVGDSQIGQNEVRQALGASGFPQSVIEGVNRFFSGQPTDLKLDQVEASIEAIEDYYAKRYNKGLGTASSILQDTKLPKSTVGKIVGQPYTSAIEKKNKAKVAALQGRDKEAYNWAKTNPNDPRSATILNKLGVR